MAGRKMTLSLGLLNVPVVVEPAAAGASGSAFRQIHRACGSAVKYRRWCPRCDCEVAWADVGKAVSNAVGDLVEITDAEMMQIPKPDKGVIAIEGFVLRTAIDTLWIHDSHYLVPPPGNNRPYRLLARALRKTRRAAIARVAFSSRERLCVVLVRQDGLIMHLLRFPEELREAPVVPAGSLDERELDLAVRLVEQLTLPVDVRELHSERRAALDRLVESKRATVTPPGSSTAADFLTELERVVREMEAAGKGA